MSNYLIIGGSSGIGKAVAEKLAEEGHQVQATYFSHPVSNDAIEYHALDVKQDELDLSFVSDELDGVVYCPGSINLLPFARIKPVDFADDYNLQVLGAIRVLQGVLKKLKKSDNGSVVLFSTVAVKTGYNFHSQVATSKGAIEGLTRSLAAEFAPGIRVNAVAPSLTATPLAAKLLNNEQKVEANAQRHPMKRVGSTNDMAAIAAFLLSDQSSWITGQVIGVDGGASAIK